MKKYGGNIKITLFIMTVLSAAFFIVQPALAHDIADPDGFEPLPAREFPPERFYLGEILKIDERENFEYGTGYLIQTMKVKILKGDMKGEELEIERGLGLMLPEYQKIGVGDRVVIAKTEAFGQTDYYIADKYRLPPLAAILAVFFAIVIFFGKWRGLTSIIGLSITVYILIGFIVPRIVGGSDPLLVGVGGAFAIAVLSIYTAHGFSKRTSIAVFATLIALGASALLAVLFVSFAKLFGGGAEEAFFLQIGGLETLNLRGLLLAGIIIGALGVLDDITTAQSAAVDEIKKANPSLGFGELYRRGLSVGKEHISSLVNTLVLAYAGSSLPLFILFSISQNPSWVTINSEFIAEEIVRTLVGSTALVLAVPISTFLAAYFFSRR